MLAVAAFVAHGLAIRPGGRAILALLLLLVGGLVGVAGLDALLQHLQASQPRGSGGDLWADPLDAWHLWWGYALLLVAGAWSGVLGYLQWRR